MIGSVCPDGIVYACPLLSSEQARPFSNSEFCEELANFRFGVKLPLHAGGRRHLDLPQNACQQLSCSCTAALLARPNPGVDPRAIQILLEHAGLKTAPSNAAVLQYQAKARAWKPNRPINRSRRLQRPNFAWPMFHSARLFTLLMRLLPSVGRPNLARHRIRCRRIRLPGPASVSSQPVARLWP